MTFDNLFDNLFNRAIF